MLVQKAWFNPIWTGILDKKIDNTLFTPNSLICLGNFFPRMSPHSSWNYSGTDQSKNQKSPKKFLKSWYLSTWKGNWRAKNPFIEKFPGLEETMKNHKHTDPQEASPPKRSYFANDRESSDSSAVKKIIFWWHEYWLPQNSKSAFIWENSRQNRRKQNGFGMMENRTFQKRNSSHVVCSARKHKFHIVFGLTNTVYSTPRTRFANYFCFNLSLIIESYLEYQYTLV